MKAFCFFSHRLVHSQHLRRPRVLQIKFCLLIANHLSHHLPIHLRDKSLF